jgi:response regulator RpfG family c-di-GMP phosphodiesterase
VITTPKYQWQVLELTAPEQEVICINLKPGIELLTQISSKPRNTKVLLVGDSESDSENMKQVLEQAGISHITFQTLNLEGIKNNSQFISQFDVICASKIEDYVRKHNPHTEKIMVFNFTVDDSNMSVLKARIATIRLAKSIV